MATHNLYEVLHVADVDQSELEELLQIHFSFSASVSTREIHYARVHGAEPALLLKYSAAGNLKMVEAGPTLEADDVPQLIKKVSDLLIDTSIERVGQQILFANLPNARWFRYRDAFQIVPVPQNAPRPKFFLAEHPMLLQFRVSGSADFSIDMRRRMRVGRELELLCTALCVDLRGSIGPVTQHHWSLVNADDPSNWRSEYCQEAYIWPEANGIAPGYAAVDALEPIPRTQANIYYTRIGISPGQQLDLPDTLEKSLDAYFVCSREEQERFMRACFWFRSAQRIGSLSYSAAFTALVSAIEALVPPSPVGTRCEECDRPFDGGLKRRFVEFVETHAPGPGVTEAERKQLYELRSALSHGGRLLHQDRHGWGGGMTSTSLQESGYQRAMWHIVRLVLVNWLLFRAKSPPA
jgi:hypothetical protein